MQRLTIQILHDLINTKERCYKLKRQVREAERATKRMRTALNIALEKE